MAVFARRTRVRARRRTCQYVEHPGRVQRGELSRLAKQAACLSQIRVRSRDWVRNAGWTPVATRAGACPPTTHSR